MSLYLARVVQFVEVWLLYWARVLRVTVNLGKRRSIVLVADTSDHGRLLCINRFTTQLVCYDLPSFKTNNSCCVVQPLSNVVSRLVNLSCLDAASMSFVLF